MAYGHKACPFFITIYARVSAMLLTRSFFRSATVAAAAAALSGCQLLPWYDSGPHKAQPMPAFATPSDGGAYLVVMRDAGNICALAPVRITVDGQTAGVLNRGERLDLYVPAGDHVVGAETNEVCPQRSVQAHTHLNAAQTQAYVVSVRFYADLKLEPTAI